MQINNFAPVPYPEVTAQLDNFSAAGLGLEIEVLDPHWILKVCQLPMAEKLGQTIAEKGLQVHVQGPFFDLAPGSLDPFIREHTRKLFLRTVEIAGHLKARYLTLYSGYNPLLHSKVIDQWFEISLPLWRETVEAADRYDMKILIANLFEETADIQLKIIEACIEEGAGACLDVANVFTYSRKKIASWINALGEKLYLVHLNDSTGKNGERLPLGQGRVPFKEFFKICMKKALTPDIVFRLPLEEAIQSLKTVRKLGLGQYQMELL
ncbi:MAG: sugar phosphate isomerase/epimerase [Armatimonadetes bacterium]|nr:sugar phosphate isomerase/epimerase [Armatimonadota bacterium]